MSLAISYSAHLVGLDAEVVTVEVDLSNGLHNFSVIGLGDRSVEESKDRVAAAIKNSGYTSPKQKNQKVVVSLAPADVRKEGPIFDLAIALTYLSATGDIDIDSKEKLFLGELSLDGHIQKINGVLPIISQVGARGFKEVFIPYQNAEEASLAQNIHIYAVKTLNEVIDHISGNKKLEKISPAPKNSTQNEIGVRKNQFSITMETIKGNEAAKRALEIAAAGAHNILMYGPPGTGKTLLAKAFPSLLPPLSYEQSLEVTSIHSAAKVLSSGLISEPPFRSPHHTSSAISIIGGGAVPKPGEVTLAHRGVLFLDEFSEFERPVIESLRQPLEERMITISRARGSVTFPAQTILIASMNPCPCGRDKGSGCVCTEKVIANYWRRISGPIMDRVDIWVHVDKIDYDKMTAGLVPGNSLSTSSHDALSQNASARVTKARELQTKRFENIKTSSGQKIYFNSEMGPDLIQHLPMHKDARATLAFCSRKMELSGRAIHRVIKVAQTIADLDHTSDPATSLAAYPDKNILPIITKEHILEALGYRKK